MNNQEIAKKASSMPWADRNVIALPTVRPVRQRWREQEDWELGKFSALTQGNKLSLVQVQQ